MTTAVGELHDKGIAFEWTISEFSELPSSSIWSPIFHDRWRIQLFPRGMCYDCVDYISVYLHSVEDKPAKASVEFRLVNYNGMLKNHESEMQFIVEEKEFVRGKGWGSENAFKMFFRSWGLHTLVDDTLTLSCRIYGTQERVEIAKLKSRATEFDAFDKLLSDESFSDVTFVLGDKKIRAHKAILSCRSSVFESMFYKREDGKEWDEIDMENVEYDVFVKFLRFLYMGKLNDLEKIADKILPLADKYVVGTLKTQCEEILCDKLSVDQALDYLVLADAHNSARVKELALDLIKAKSQDIVGNNPEFERFNSSHPRLGAEIAREFVSVLRGEKFGSSA